MIEKKEVAKQRVRNSPPMKEIIREFLKREEDAVTLERIYEYVLKKVTLVSKTPHNSVLSVLYRMDDIQRVSKGQYRLKGK